LVSLFRSSITKIRNAKRTGREGEEERGIEGEYFKSGTTQFSKLGSGESVQCGSTLRFSVFFWLGISKLLLGNLKLSAFKV
jgi:hypothetical protein